MNNINYYFVCFLSILLCACIPSTKKQTNHSALPQPILGQGLNIDSNAINNMAIQMTNDLLEIKQLHRKRIIIDEKHFKNQSSNFIDKALITEKLRVGLMRSAKGKIIFISDEYREQAEFSLAAHYRFGGKILSLDGIDPRTGARTRYTQITFNLFNLEDSTLLWTNQYELNKAVTGLPMIYR